MGCTRRTIQIRKHVWSNGETSAQFIPFTVLENPDAYQVRVSYLLESATGDIEVRRAQRGSNDGYTWDTATQFGSGFNGSEGFTWATAYFSVPGGDQFTEYGMVARNSSSSDANMAIVTMIIDIRSA